MTHSARPIPARPILIKGPGSTYYHSNRHFLKVPDGKHFGQQVRRVAVDSRDRVYVCHRSLYGYSLPPVSVFDSDGSFLGGWGDGMFEGLHGIFITPDDHVFLVDTDRHQVFEFTTDGELLMTLGSRRPVMDAPFNHPSDVVVSGRGFIYVGDGDANTRVHKFAPDGTHLLSWGKAGKGPGALTSPHSICLDAEGRVYIGDRDTGRIVVFSSDGDFVTEWTDILRAPSAVHMGADEILYVSDTICRVHMYTPAGAVLGRAHAAAPPHDIYRDGTGSLYLALPSEVPYIEKWEILSDAEVESILAATHDPGYRSR
jgi:hypothetical protein